jgi:mono/diheme cytochrome c family protein
MPFRIGWFEGIFRVPNISPHAAAGIGDWSAAEFVNAMKRGVSPDGRHYYPSFPYTSYTRMTTADVLDLKAYIDTLPPVDSSPGAHELTFPLNVRRGLGLWKRLYLSEGHVQDVGARSEEWRRGRYLVEGPGHCAECHTPRDRLAGLNAGLWMAGAPNSEGTGRVPNITPHDDGLADWSLSDIGYYLESGFTPEFDAVGGSMVDVQENLARLPAADRAAIARYLSELPPVPDP